MKAELVKLKNCTSACLNLRYALTSENYRTSQSNFLFQILSPFHKDSGWVQGEGGFGISGIELAAAFTDRSNLVSVGCTQELVLTFKDLGRDHFS